MTTEIKDCFTMIDVVISMCDKSGVMVRPWAEAGCVCICVDIQHSIRATRAGKHKIERLEGGGAKYISFMVMPGVGNHPRLIDSFFQSTESFLFHVFQPVQIYPDPDHRIGS